MRTDGVVLALAAAGLLAAGLVVSARAGAAPGRAQRLAAAAPNALAQRPRFFLVIHGGAGTIRRSDLSPEQEAAYRERLTAALQAGYAPLERGGSSLDAVEAAIRVMEDSPLFNAGKGAVFDHEGKNELDASIMDGRTLAAGAVAGVQHIRNPIALARLVMEKSPHVLMVGAGAETFARSQGMKLVPQSYFFTERRWQDLQRTLEREKKAGKPVIGFAPLAPRTPPGPADPEERLVHLDSDRHGTVGAVALDASGNLAAATSTGGMTNKRFGRVGDSPIVGAGTYADNASCAVSATGDGEYFIRNVASRTICARVEFLHENLEQAARAVIDRIGAQGGSGGVIVLDREGHYAMVFNSEGMYRGHIGPDGKAVIQIYKE